MKIILWLLEKILGFFSSPGERPSAHFLQQQRKESEQYYAPNWDAQKMREQNREIIPRDVPAGE